ncbi:MAG: type I restriction-modification system subunit M N-terminal domain-containing protein [Spirochaetaceae bacterium]|jgi:type I restriction-modification system DNA methylase subunit|nr:type I restriction-modification system subunit M N-terminal domain-containing protein [Spirochaetaceae bacterium]
MAARIKNNERTIKEWGSALFFVRNLCVIPLTPCRKQPKTGGGLERRIKGHSVAVKKKELYGPLWASCNKLRGGVDASQYKDYILTLLFVKYVSDRLKGEKYADINVPTGGSFDDMVSLISDKNIGEGMDKVIACLAEANSTLRGVIDNTHFNDETKLGKGKKMADKLSGLIAIFRRPELDFRSNRSEGDDIIGDAYESLCANLQPKAAKAKGSFTLRRKFREFSQKSLVSIMKPIVTLLFMIRHVVQARS